MSFDWSESRVLQCKNAFIVRMLLFVISVFFFFISDDAMIISLMAMTI